MIEIQSQMKHNQEDIKQFVKDLDEWKSDIKTKDAKLKHSDRCAAVNVSKI